MQALREEEEQQFSRLMEEQSMQVERLKREVELKEQELRRHIINESNLKTQEMMQSSGDFILRQQSTPKASVSHPS